MVEKIKTNWKNILLVILSCLFLSKCTQSCNREIRATKAEHAVDSLVAVTHTQSQEILDLCKDTANYINQIRMYTDFNLKRDAQDSINNANIAAQQAQTNRLLNENQKLQRENNKLKH